MTSAVAPAALDGQRPPRSSLVLLALVTGAIVSNINLSIANVALPTIGADLGATQDQLTSIANAFALGLASTVLYLGTIGDRYGRKLLFVAGAILTIPTSMLAAWAPNPDFLTYARFACGFAAALLFPTTLSLIGALYRGRARVGAIALWSGLGGGVAALGPLIGGWLLQYFWWGSVFLVSLPLVVLALIVGLIVLPWKASEEVFPVDHLGGVLSVLGVGGLVLTIEHADKGISPRWLGYLAMALVGLSAFIWRETKATRPLVSLPLAKARTFWVAFVAGAITFGSLIGAMFIGQQFTQNVLGYDALKAAAVVLP
jgi:DHA2 family multidrug resistance protein-like MFS transporter